MGRDGEVGLGIGPFGLATHLLMSGLIFQLIIIIVLLIGALNFGLKLVKTLKESGGPGAALGAMIKKVRAECD